MIRTGAGIDCDNIRKLHATNGHQLAAGNRELMAIITAINLSAAAREVADTGDGDIGVIDGGSTGSQRPAVAYRTAQIVRTTTAAQLRHAGKCNVAVSELTSAGDLKLFIRAGTGDLAGNCGRDTPQRQAAGQKFAWRRTESETISICTGID